MDEQIVEKVLRGDRKAFAVLVDKYEQPVYNVAYRILRNADDAADVTQTTFLKAYEKLATFNQSRRFFSWLYRIAINEALNLSRSRPRDSSPNDQDPPAASPSPEEDYAAHELQQALQRGLAAVSFDHRVVLILRHLLALSHREIAEVLQIPEKTVKSRLHEGRLALKDRLVAQGYVR